MIRKLRRRIAEIRLVVVDAEIAHWYVHDGQLSPHPLSGEDHPSLRSRRLEAVRRLESLGGYDPWPSVLIEPSPAQRAAHRGYQLLGPAEHAPPPPAKPAEPTIGFPHS